MKEMMDFRDILFDFLKIGLLSFPDSATLVAQSLKDARGPLR